MPLASEMILRLNRRELIACGLLAVAGCKTPSARLQSPDSSEEAAAETLLVGDLAVPFGTQPIEVSAVAIVTGLNGTGGEASPSSERDILVSDLLKRGVDKPSELLKNPGTSMVLVRGFLRPGIQKGDHFDLEVRVPSQSKTSSLRGGWLMETQLREHAMLNSQIREGHPLAIASGSVVIDPSASSEDKIGQTRGRVLGGGLVLQSRSLGLVLKPKHQSFGKSARIGDVVNRRFHTYINGVQKGVCNPKTNEFIDLTVHPRYKDNVGRYIQVVRSIALRETSADKSQRLQTLEKRLYDPVTAPMAALRLEAVGEESLKVLQKATEADDITVRFYAAEALAYMNDSAAAKPLADAAREVPEFRIFAFTALSAMDDGEAREELRKLMDSASAETRYGAFRALWAMSANDPLVKGEILGGQFSYHVIDSSGPPMIHVTRSFRPEIVVFGHEQEFQSPLVLDAVSGGNHVVVNCPPGGTQVQITGFKSGEDNKPKTVSLKVDEVIRAVVEKGASYPDVVQMLQQAKESKSMPGRFEIDALPEFRGFKPTTDEADGQDKPTVKGSGAVALPDLFASAGGKKKDENWESSPKLPEEVEESEKKPGLMQRLFGKMKGNKKDE